MVLPVRLKLTNLFWCPIFESCIRYEGSIDRGEGQAKNRLVTSRFESIDGPGEVQYMYVHIQTNIVAEQFLSFEVALFICIFTLTTLRQELIWVLNNPSSPQESRELPSWKTFLRCLFFLLWILRNFLKILKNWASELNQQTQISLLSICGRSENLWKWCMYTLHSHS